MGIHPDDRHHRGNPVLSSNIVCVIRIPNTPETSTRGYKLMCPFHDSAPPSSMQTNSMDIEGGVLVGNWGSDYPEGTTRPTTWNGSTAILEEFWKSKKAVRYGQCWVFSGLVTTCKYYSQRSRLHQFSPLVFLRFYTYT